MAAACSLRFPQLGWLLAWMPSAQSCFLFRVHVRRILDVLKRPSPFMRKLSQPWPGPPMDLPRPF